MPTPIQISTQHNQPPPEKHPVTRIALIGNPPLVFLDEPTEGLDQAGQMVVAKLLSRLTQQGCTLVVVSNEAFILRSADLLIDMGKKPVPLVGTPRPATGADGTATASTAASAPAVEPPLRLT